MITRGGAKRMMFPWVGFARRPLSFMATHRSQAVEDSGESLMITAFSNPRPRTSLISEHSFAMSSIPARKRAPRVRAA